MTPRLFITGLRDATADPIVTSSKHVARHAHMLGSCLSFVYRFCLYSVMFMYVLWTDVPCLCMCVSAWRCVSLYVTVGESAYVCATACAHLRLSVSVCVCLCLSVSVRVCLCLSVSVCVCLWLSVPDLVCVAVRGLWALGDVQRMINKG